MRLPLPNDHGDESRPWTNTLRNMGDTHATSSDGQGQTLLSQLDDLAVHDPLYLSMLLHELGHCMQYMLMASPVMMMNHATYHSHRIRTYPAFFAYAYAYAYSRLGMGTYAHLVGARF